MMRRRLLIAIAFVTATAACGDGGGPALVADGEPRASYTITVAADDKGTDPRTWTLECDPSGGDHPDAAAACGVLAASDDPFAPVPSDMACTQIYGGSGVATVTGTRDGAAVDARFTRTDGCEISRWDALGAVLPGPVPGQPTDQPL